MIGTYQNHRNEHVNVSVEELVPKDHFLRTIEETIDFSFIEEKIQPYYCQNNGRPSIPPITLFKMMFIGYFYGIRSERQLEKEIKVNVAYRWFLGLSLTDKVPDHSTISFNRRTRFLNTTIAHRENGHESTKKDNKYLCLDCYHFIRTSLYNLMGVNS